ncbi:MAG: D-glycero-beta-D-manno-heptose-7-phosphate kinase [Candidatus Tectomicrobia bacterium]|uniref:Bifunctional protein HldE n=1 Tax=Tectimicrobiota bacterium TaxID=2528274 RepID=A0A932FZA4_UNCTE|nr:D-glycero-beta-D-manno-heptose-7-phosphate kinase [Candidatus Tectomicrobia bacterium]
MEGILKEIVSRAPETQVLVLGDLILDEYLWGKIDRISPEAPVPIVELEWSKENFSLGGAANVAHNLAHLGAQVLLAGTLGADERGAQMRAMLQGAGIDAQGVIEDSSRPTTCKTRILAHNQQILRLDREARHEISPALEGRLWGLIEPVLPRVTGIVLSDYRKGVLSDSLLQALLSQARARKIPVVVDPKGKDYTRYRGATVLTPNQKEAEAAAGVQIGQEEDLEAAGRYLLETTACDYLLVTRGKDGMSLFQRGGLLQHIPTVAREVFDVTGAGDTVISVFGLGLFLGGDPLEAARLANLAAGLVVSKVGTVPISHQELTESVAQEIHLRKKRVATLGELRILVNWARSQGKRIVFTNGCFDLLHAGHIYYLQKARTLGDLLIVGLNDDHSVRQLKGSDRPLISQEERASILAALGCIDHVYIFNELTPASLLREIRPDVLVKGGDYTLETVVGRDFVESYGGRVVLIPYVAGHSTTGLVQQIVENHQKGRTSPCGWQEG